MEADTYSELYEILVLNGHNPDDYEAHQYAYGNKVRLIARFIDERGTETWSVSDAINWFNES